MSLKLQIAVLAGVAALIATPCFAFSVTEAPAKSENASLAGFLDAGVSNLLHDLNSSQAPTDRATQHGAMVTYTLSSHASPAQSAGGRDLIAAHPADPSVNPFMGGS